MKEILFFFLTMYFSLGQSTIKKSRRSKHGEDCISDAACEEGFFCKQNRCYTKYESNNLKFLGLLDSNICSTQKKCPQNKKCIKHRCVDINTPEEPKKIKTGKIDDVNLIFAGGVFLTNKPYLSGIKPDNTINYDHLFANISKYIKSADLAIISEEYPFYINLQEKKFVKNYKNTPKELGDALVKAGFKVILHASTKIYNLKGKGVEDTINYWKVKYPEVRPLGISSTSEDKNDYYIFSKNNIKIAIINYSGFEGKSIPQKDKFMVNIINRKNVEELIQKIKPKVDFIIVCINWGAKYSLTPNKIQVGWAKILADLGVNLIIGNSPAYVQPVSYVRSQSGNCTLVFFSLGSFLAENTVKPDALGALADITISKENGKTFVSSYNLIPTINHQGNKNDFSVYKLSDYNDKLGKEFYKKFSIDKVKKNCRETMGSFANCD